MIYWLTWGLATISFTWDTYDPSKPKETGGTLTMYSVVNDPNNIIVEEVPGFSWSGLCKIKSIDFKKY